MAAETTFETLPGLSAETDQPSVNTQKTGRPSKRCSTCQGDNATAAKKCRSCGGKFARKEPDDGISKMGRTNPTKQFNMLKHRAKILNFHHDWDIVVMARHKHGRGTSYVTFGTPDLGQDFIGDKGNPSTAGKAVLDVFCNFASQYSSKPPTPKPSTEPVSEAPPASSRPSDSSVDPLSTSLSASNGITPTSAHPPSTSINTQSPKPQPSAPHFLPIINQRSTTLTTETPVADQSSISSTPSFSISYQPSVGGQEVQQPPTIPSDAVVLLDKGKIVGVGRSTDLASIHGVPLPDNHHCVVLTWAQENHPAPCPIGRQDLEENLFLHKDMFYAVPSSMLKRFIRSNDKYVILPFIKG